ncbi:MAG: tetratricopeptide repeat protein, partial [Mariprofundus sp.]
MNDKTVVKGSEPIEENAPLQGEMDELKREMRSAQWTHWAQANQKQIIIALVAVVVMLMAGGLWLEQNKSQAASAATLYQQALVEQDADKKQALLHSVVEEFGSSSYGALALMQLARFDQEKAAAHLNALISHGKAMKEWVWQARLDLAAMKITQGDKAAASALLDKMVGKQYQQLRHYLMAEATDDAAAKAEHLQKALDAES